MCHHTVRKSWDVCKLGSGAVGSMPDRAFEGSGHAVLPGPTRGWPGGLYLCPLYLRLYRRPGDPLCLSVSTSGGTATSMPCRSRAAALSKAAEDQGHPAPPLTRSGADA